MCSIHAHPPPASDTFLRTSLESRSGVAGSRTVDGGPACSRAVRPDGPTVPAPAEADTDDRAMTASKFMYGQLETTIEQINNTTGTVLYLHHDQAGSTRLLTGSTGKTEGSYSYNAYGTPEHTGTATTPLGYDGEYTSSDTGLIYLRNRVYDPAGLS